MDKDNDKRTFRIEGTFSVTDPADIDDFLDALGWSQDDGTLAEALESEIGANFDDLLRGSWDVSISVEEVRVRPVD